FYFPWIIVLTSRPEPSLARSLRLVPLVVLQCLTDLVYVAAAVLTPLTVLAAVRCVRPETRRAGFTLLAVIGLALLVLSPAYAGHLALGLGRPGFLRQTVWTDREPALLRGSLFVRDPLAIPQVAWVLIALGGAHVLAGWRKQAEPRQAAWRASIFWVIAAT